MPTMGQVVLENVLNFWDTTVTNGQHVEQTRTSNQKVVTGMAAVTGFIPIAGINACWRRMAKTVALFMVPVDVLLVKIQHRRTKSTF